MGDLREQVRVGTLQRMERALADVDAKLEGLRAERDRLVASINEVERRPPGRPEDAGMPMSKDAREREQAHAEALYRPDPAETSPAYREAWARGVQAHSNRLRDALGVPRIDLLRTSKDDAGRPPPRRPPGQEEDPIAVVRLRADGELVVSAPGTPPHRIVAIREKHARAAGQRVAELVEEALQARERLGG